MGKVKMMLLSGQQPSPTAGPGPNSGPFSYQCHSPGLAGSYVACHQRGGCKREEPSAPSPSTGESTGEVICGHPCTQKLWCEEPCAFACDVDHSRVGCACAAHIAAKFEFAAAPPRKTPGELAHAFCWVHGLCGNNPPNHWAACQQLADDITADRGGR